MSVHQANVRALDPPPRGCRPRITSEEDVVQSLRFRIVLTPIDIPILALLQLLLLLLTPPPCVEVAVAGGSVLLDALIRAGD